MNEQMHSEGVIRCDSLYAGPCECGIHINLEIGRGNIIATAVISPDDCEELIKQIRRSKRSWLKYAPTPRVMGRDLR